jgi:LysR family nitrogen assimilation transcriptional regulator
MTLGVPPAAGEVLIPPVVRRCNETYPGIRLNIVEGFSGFLYERLLNQELTLSLLHNPAPHNGLHITPLLIDHMYLVGPGRGVNGVPPADAAQACRLEDLPLILPGRPHSLRLLIENTLAERGRNLRIQQQVDGLMMIKSLVAAGIGYTVLTYGSVYNEVETGKLSAVPIRDPEIAWTLCIARRQEPATVRPVQAVIEIIRSEAHKLIDEGIWRGTPQFLSDKNA